MKKSCVHIIHIHLYMCVRTVGDISNFHDESYGFPGDKTHTNAPSVSLVLMEVKPMMDDISNTLTPAASTAVPPPSYCRKSRANTQSGGISLFSLFLFSFEFFWLLYPGTERSRPGR